MTLLLLSTTLASPAGPHERHLHQFGDTARPFALDGTPAHPPPPPGVERATVYGYHPYWGSDPTELDYARLTHLAIFNVDVNSDGTLSDTGNWTGVAGAVVPLAHTYGVKVHVCVTSFSSSVHSSVLGSSSRRATLVAELATLVDDYGADGVNVDFEGLSETNRDLFATFIEELAAAVDEVYLATPAVDWSRAFDYERLAAASQGLFIMGYGYHWTGGDPGPNDPLYGGGAWGQYALDWTIDDYLDHGAPADKIVLGLPLYGQEWPAGSSVPGSAYGDGWSVVMDEAESIAASEGRSYDKTTWSPYVLRADTQLWYDDNASVQDRIHWSVSERGIAGVGFWALTYEGADTGFWDMVEEETVQDAADDTGGDNSGDNSGDNGGDKGGDKGGDNAGDNSGDSGGDNGGSGAPTADVEHAEAAEGCQVAPVRSAFALAFALAFASRRRQGVGAGVGGGGAGGAAIVG